jgi:hypothetical protein
MRIGKASGESMLPISTVESLSQILKCNQGLVRRVLIKIKGVGGSLLLPQYIVWSLIEPMSNFSLDYRFENSGLLKETSVNLTAHRTHILY